MADDLDLNKLQVEASGGWAGGLTDWIGAFAKSAVQSVPELVGITPDQDTLAWRAQNPWSGFASEIAGTAVPYGGWLKIARGIKPLEAVASGIEAAKLERPFVAPALAEATRLAPFEVGRTLASIPLGDKPLGEMATEAGINLALGSSLAGGLGVLGSARRTARPLTEIMDGVDSTAPPQLVLRKVDELRGQAPPEALASFDDHVARLDLLARNETAGAGTRYVDAGIDPKGELERLFKPGQDYGQLLEKQKPVTGTEPGTFQSEDGWRGVFSSAGVDPLAVSRDMQFPRVLTVNSAREIEAQAVLGEAGPLKQSLRRAENLENSLRKNLEPVGDGWLLAREPNNGMYVMARKVAGAEGTPGSSDRWLLFKTDKPGKFAKNAQGLQNTLVAKEKWLVGPTAVEKNVGRPGELFSDTAELTRKFSFDHYNDAVGAGGAPGRMDKLAARVLPEAVRNNAASQTAKDFVREYLTPAARQLTKSVRGNWVLNMGRMIQESADTFYQRLLQGNKGFQGGRAVFSKIVPAGEAGTVRSVEAILGDLQKEGLLAEFHREVLNKNIGAAGAQEMAAAGRIQPRTAALARELETVDRLQHKQLNITQEAAGKSRTPYREGDYGLTRRWDGDFLHLVREEGGRIAAVASSNTARGAEVKARELATKLAGETGGKYQVAEGFARGGEVPKDARSFMAGNATVRGWQWDLAVPRLQDYLKEYHTAFESRAREAGANMREALLARHQASLAVEDPFAYRVVSKRFDQLAGKEGEFSQMQNKLADKVLSRFLGKNSASKIVRVTNTGLTHLTLGAGKLSQPIQNIVSVVQMIAPELAFVMNARPGDVALKYMGTAPAVGTRGVVGGVSFLAPVKILGQALKATFKPEAELQALVARGLNERVLDARVAEEFIGQNRKALNFKEGISSPQGLLDLTRALSDYMPQASEKFARAMSFNSAYLLGRDVLKISDKEELFQFMKRFTERTNFLYSSADRPLAFTSPIGSSLGLFKTWQMNYIGLMAEYAGQGLNKGVWSPLIWQTLATGATAGIAGTPVYWLADGASKLFADKKLIQYAYDEYGTGADGMVFGLPAALTGVSLSSITSSPGANPVRDATQLFSFAAWQRMQELGKVAGAAFDNWQTTGMHPASDPDVRNGLIKALAPVTLSRAMSVDEEGTIRNIVTNMPSARGLTWLDKMIYSTGLNPVAVDRQMAATEELYRDREAMKAATKGISDALADAWRTGRSDQTNNILQRALVLGVDVSSAIKGAVHTQSLEQKTSPERLAKPAALAAWQNVLNP